MVSNQNLSGARYGVSLTIKTKTGDLAVLLGRDIFDSGPVCCSFDSQGSLVFRAKDEEGPEFEG